MITVLNLKRLVMFSLLALLSACAEKARIEFHCEQSHAVAEDGSIVTVSNAVFDLTVDLRNETVSSKRYPNFGVLEPRFDAAFIQWSAALEGKDPYSIPSYTYTLSRYTGDLRVSRLNEDFEPSIAQGRCVTTEPIF